MFCDMCGTKLPELSEFCPECGFKINENKKAKTKIDDLEVKLTIKPYFDSSYLGLRLLVAFGALILSLSIIIAIVVSIKVGVGIFIVSSTLVCLVIPAKIKLDKAIYDSCFFDFYDKKVVYKNTFLGESQREIKYNHIREIYMSQSYIQKYFGLGNIRLLTSAEVGTGIYIKDCRDINNIYNELKNIINV